MFTLTYTGTDLALANTMPTNVAWSLRVVRSVARVLRVDLGPAKAGMIIA
ncbi:hypothetical protein LCGC14_2193120 [marine sediment metagenome]|uniref:Uncharacterized protein n=1 Tax=marine sediment metagenome TaxID=412755 RepID=A0A0F9DJ20_9ZZZZ